MDRREFLVCSLLAGAGSALPTLAQAMPPPARTLWLVTGSHRGDTVATALHRQGLRVERVDDDAPRLWYGTVAPALALGRTLYGVSTHNLAPVMASLAHLRGRAMSPPSLPRPMPDMELPNMELYAWALRPWRADRPFAQEHN